VLPRGKQVRWWRVLAELSSCKDERCLAEWKLVRVFRSVKGQRCICGTPIKLVYVISNVGNGAAAFIGSCCARRLGVALSFKSKSDYLNSALFFAKNEWERRFIQSFLDRLPRYGGRLLVTRRQADVLGRITGVRWRWRVWDALRV